MTPAWSRAGRGRARIGRHLHRALEIGSLCANDPVCGGHSLRGDYAERFLEGSACHGCLFVASIFLDEELCLATRFEERSRDLARGRVRRVVWAPRLLGVRRQSEIPLVPEVADRPALQPSSFATLVVAAALAIAALVVLARGDLLLTSLQPKLSTLACAVLGAVFVLRAIGEFRTVGFFKSVRDTEFAWWDSWLFSPLCLVIGLGALWLVTTPRAD